jgi:hypothetical protein
VTRDQLEDEIRGALSKFFRGVRGNEELTDLQWSGAEATVLGVFATEFDYDADDEADLELQQELDEAER